MMENIERRGEVTPLNESSCRLGLKVLCSFMLIRWDGSTIVDFDWGNRDDNFQHLEP